MVESFEHSRTSSTRYEDKDGFVGDYRPGYEPSAPPYYSAPEYYPRPSSPPSPHSSPLDDELRQQHLHPRHEDEFPRSPRDPYFGPAEEQETLGGYLFRRIVQPVWRGSRTVLRLDLRRSLKYNGPVVRSGRRRGAAPAGASASRGGREYYDEEEETQASRGWLNGIQGGGARLKLMQEGRESRGGEDFEIKAELFCSFVEAALVFDCGVRGMRFLKVGQLLKVWDVPQHWIGDSRKRWDINWGFGMNVELDKGQLHPKLRLKARHVALHLLPVPEVELRGKWPILGTRLAVNAKYRIPLATTFEEIWTSSGARLMISFFNPLDTGLHLTPGGLEFDEHLVKLGEHTKLRLAASVDFPRKFPLEEGEQPIRLRVHRLGLKTVIMPAGPEEVRSQHADVS